MTNPLPDDAGLLQRARQLVTSSGRCYVFYVRRELGCDWDTAEKLILGLEDEGTITRPDPSGVRRLRTDFERVHVPVSPREPPPPSKVSWEDRLSNWLQRFSKVEVDRPQEIPIVRKTAMKRTEPINIGTISFARCNREMIISPKERVRLILAAADWYEPDLLITAGHAVETLKHLRRLAAGYAELGHEGGIVTEVHHDQEEESKEETHAMYGVNGGGAIHSFGRQVFAFHKDVPDESAPDLARFVQALPQRTATLYGCDVFALICGEINLARAGNDPRILSPEAAREIMAADVVVNPTHDVMGRSHLLEVKREMLSRARADGSSRIYVSCSNWECGDENGRIQEPPDFLHTVYVSGQPIECEEEFADGAFGFVYRHWSVKLR